jgi:hypothetical protein
MVSASMVIMSDIERLCETSYHGLAMLAKLV